MLNGKAELRRANFSGHVVTTPFDVELAALCADILANSWYANLVIKRALIETEGLTLKDAYALDLFKNEGLAPDAAKRVTKFCKKKKSTPDE